MSVISITFGEVAENGPHMERLGIRADDGFSYLDLVHAKWDFEARGFQCELINLISAGGVEELGGEEGPEPAYILIVRNGVEALGGNANKLEREQQRLSFRGMPPDSKAIFRGVVKNKIARHNLCFAENAQEPAYEEGRGRIVPFNEVPLLKNIRDSLSRFFGPKADALYAEGNYYYDKRKCGIGFHGDAERRRVVAIRLGLSFPLHYQWFHRWNSVGKRIALSLHHGDIYAMSTKAVGTDWKSSSIPTLRHAAGADKYLAVRR